MKGMEGLAHPREQGHIAEGYGREQAPVCAAALIPEGTVPTGEHLLKHLHEGKADEGFHEMRVLLPQGEG